MWCLICFNSYLLGCFEMLGLIFAGLVHLLVKINVCNFLKYSLFTDCGIIGSTCIQVLRRRAKRNVWIWRTPIWVLCNGWYAHSWLPTALFLSFYKRIYVFVFMTVHIYIRKDVPTYITYMHACVHEYTKTYIDVSLYDWNTYMCILMSKYDTIVCGLTLWLVCFFWFFLS